MTFVDAHWLAFLIDDLKSSTEAEGLKRVSAAIEQLLPALAADLEERMDSLLMESAANQPQRTGTEG